MVDTSRTSYTDPRPPGMASRAARMVRAAVIAIGVALGLSIACTPLHAADEATLRGHVAALASDRFAERNAATVALIEAGEAAVPLVGDAVQSGDREASYRGLLVLRRLLSGDDLAARRAARKQLASLSQSDDRYVARLSTESLRVVFDEAVRQLQTARGSITRDDAGRIQAINFAHKDVDDAALAPLDDVAPLELNLTNTRITDATLERLAIQTQLELLNLMATKVTDDGLKHVANLTALHTFSVERTAVSDAGLAHLKNMKDLKTLYLGGSRVAGPGLAQIEHLPIEYLSFAYSPIDDASVEHVARIKSLKTLGLDDTKITDACLPALAALPNLEVLWLDNTAVTDAAIPHLKQLAKLKTLHFKNTQISSEGRARLRRELGEVQLIGADVPR